MTGGAGVVADVLGRMLDWRLAHYRTSPIGADLQEHPAFLRPVIIVRERYRFLRRLAVSVRLTRRAATQPAI